MSARTLFSVFLALVPSCTLAQQKLDSDKLYVSAADLAAALAKAGNAPIVDTNARTIDIGENRYRINIVRRTEANMPVDQGISHNKQTEIYYVIEGVGVLIFGGSLVEAKEEATENGGNIRGKDVKGGTQRRITPGDVIVIPAGTPHRFVSVEGKLVYLDVKVNPDHR